MFDFICVCYIIRQEYSIKRGGIMIHSCLILLSRFTYD